MDRNVICWMRQIFKIKFHFFPPGIVLCLQKWGFAAFSQIPKATAEWKELLFTSLQYTLTHTFMQRSHYCTFSSIAIHSLLPSGALWLPEQLLGYAVTRPTSPLNSPCILRGPITKKGQEHSDNGWTDLTSSAQLLYSGENQHLKRRFKLGLINETSIHRHWAQIT